MGADSAKQTKFSMPIVDQRFSKFDADRNNALSVDEVSAMSTQEAANLFFEANNYSSFTSSQAKTSGGKISEQAAGVFSQLNTSMQANVLLTNSSYSSNDVLIQKVAALSCKRAAEIVLELKNTAEKKYPTSPTVGFNQVLFLLGKIDSSIKQKVLDELEKLDPKLCAQLKLRSSYLDPKKAFITAIKESDVVLIGETHNISDEKLIASWMREAKENGVKFLAIEFSEEEQAGWNYYLETNGKLGPSNEFLKDFHKLFPEYLNLIQEAHRNGIKVVCVDAPLQYRKYVGIRDISMAAKIEELAQDGKVLGLFGFNHVKKSTTYPTSLATNLLENTDLKVSSIMLQGKTQIEEFYRHNMRDLADKLSNFSHDYYDTLGFKDSKAVDLSQVSNTDNSLFHKANFDYVIFLSESDESLEKGERYRHMAIMNSM